VTPSSSEKPIAAVGRRTLAALVAASVLVCAVHPVAAESIIAREATDALSRHRAVSGLLAVDGDLEAGAQAHASYLARNFGRPEVAGLRVHEEDASLPGATAEGATAAKRSHVASGDQSAAPMIDGLIGAPLHRHALMDPRLDRIGIGRSGEGTRTEPYQWVVDLSSADRPWVGAPLAVAYPGPGQMHVPMRFADGETPDPRAAVAGLAAAINGMGYPITLSFFGCRPTATTARLTAIGTVSPDGTVAATGDSDVPIYLLTPGTTIRTDTGDRDVEPVLFFAREVLRPQTAFRATVSATCGSLGTNTYEWTFATRPRLRAADVTVSVGAPAPDGSQDVVLIADAGGVAVGARVSEVQASFTTLGSRTGSGPVVGGAPEIDLTEPRADVDGRMRLRVNLRGAASADVTATVTDEGISIPVTFTMRPVASGALRAVVPLTAPFPRLLNARPSWVPSLDGG
jgi:hypothetical protein